MAKQVPMAVLADWCRALGTPLRAGLSLKDAARLSSKKAPAPIAALSSSLLQRLDDGDDLPTALGNMPAKFPPLFTAMGHAGTSTGSFPEMLKELERFYRFQLTLRRQFISQITLPIMQLVAAVFIIAGVIWLLGIIAGSGKLAIDPTGLGLRGTSGAVAWLLLCFGAAGTLWFVLFALRYIGRGGQVDGVLLRVPALGPALQALALSRLCFAMRVTMDSTLSLGRSIPLCLAATDNEAYKATAKPIARAVKKDGEKLHEAFGGHGTALYPEEFVHVLQGAEEAGAVPEEMGRLAGHYNEVAEARLRTLNTVAGQVVWALVAAIIIFFIFRMALSYIGILNSAVDAVNKGGIPDL